MISEKVQISTEEITAVFEEHLSQPNNNRVVFSAPFGAGKTTFLNTFFNSSSKYISLKLYPIHYSLAPNEDVFELIKYDLLYELLSKFPVEIDLKKEEFSDLLLSQTFIMQKSKTDLLIKLLAKAADVLAESNKVKKAALEQLIEIIKDYRTYKQEVTIDELDIIKRYTKSFENKKGSIYENDEVTKLITKLLIRVKEKLHAKSPDIEQELVLIIDDLDRLDPEHIFRLFNIFSAHHDEVREINKFEFDKIIFVCYANNISQMFKHKYGIDYNGYIDKFYSTEIFRFNIQPFLKKSLEFLLLQNQTLFKYFQTPNSIDPSFVKSTSITNNSVLQSFRYITDKFIDLDIVQLRNFQKFSGYYLPNFSIKVKHLDLHIVYYPLLVFFTNLERIFPIPNDLLNALKYSYQNFESDYSSTKPKSDDLNTINLLIQLTISFLEDENWFLSDVNDESKREILMVDNEFEKPFQIIYNNFHSRGFSFKTPNLILGTMNDTGLIDKDIQSPKPNPFFFLFIAYKNILNRKYLEGINTKS